MQIVSDIENFAAPWEYCALTLGDCDGIHLWHRKWIDSTLKSADKLKLPAIVVTYEPSPKKVLQKLKFDSTVYTKEEKITLLQKFPLRAAVFLPFDIQMARMKASDFLQKILLKKLKARHIIIGYDHKFGHNRHGDFKYLKMASKKKEFYVDQIKPVKLFRQPVSSSEIRRLLTDGKIKKANRLLAHPYILHGTVILGKQRGRLLGVPTANLHVEPGKLVPGQGVYYCIAQFGVERYQAVVNIGYNPTFENADMTIEAHLLDFSANIYGESLKLFFIERIRDEKKFENINSLKTQIDKDIKKARSLSTPEF